MPLVRGKSVELNTRLIAALLEQVEGLLLGVSSPATKVTHWLHIHVCVCVCKTEHCARSLGRQTNKYRTRLSTNHARQSWRDNLPCYLDVMHIYIHTYIGLLLWITLSPVINVKCFYLIGTACGKLEIVSREVAGFRLLKQSQCWFKSEIKCLLKRDVQKLINLYS